MSNIRRSVTDTLSSRFRPKSAIAISPSAEMAPDLHGLGLSVTMPASAPPTPAIPQAKEKEKEARTVGSGLRRKPVSPTMHSRGSILLEMKGIEDEESRRLSEMAFLA